MDHLTPAARSANMAAVHSKNTGPELAMRALLRSAGFGGYRLHRRDLPGSPDIAYGRWRVAVFVDGAFWHGHPRYWHPDRAPSDAWRLKIDRNMERDRRVNDLLADRGWEVVRVWDKDLRREPRSALVAVVAALARAGNERAVSFMAEIAQ